MYLDKKKKSIELLDTKKAIYYRLLIDRVKNLILQSSFSEEEILKKSRQKRDEVYNITRQVFYTILKNAGYSFHDLSFIFNRSVPSIIHAVKSKERYRSKFYTLKCGRYILPESKIKIATYSNFYNYLWKQDKEFCKDVIN